jgi:hypothetical protein
VKNLKKITLNRNFPEKICRHGNFNEFYSFYSLKNLEKYQEYLVNMGVFLFTPPNSRKTGGDPA